MPTDRYVVADSGLPVRRDRPPAPPPDNDRSASAMDGPACPDCGRELGLASFTHPEPGVSVIVWWHCPICNKAHDVEVIR